MELKYYVDKLLDEHKDKILYSEAENDKYYIIELANEDGQIIIGDANTYFCRKDKDEYFSLSPNDPRYEEEIKGAKIIYKEREHYISTAVLWREMDFYEKEFYKSTRDDFIRAQTKAYFKDMEIPFKGTIEETYVHYFISMFENLDEYVLFCKDENGRTFITIDITNY